jgi:hypothetical protein
MKPIRFASISASFGCNTELMNVVVTASPLFSAACIHKRHFKRFMGQSCLSPHIAGVDSTALDDMAEQAARCVIELYRGRLPEGFVLNEELRPGWRW